MAGCRSHLAATRVTKKVYSRAAALRHVDRGRGPCSPRAHSFVIPLSSPLTTRAFPSRQLPRSPGASRHAAQPRQKEAAAAMLHRKDIQHQASMADVNWLAYYNHMHLTKRPGFPRDLGL